MRFKVLPASRQPTKLWFDALSLQPRCRTKRRTPGRPQRRHLRRGHDPARARPARSRQCRGSHRARFVAHPGRTLAPPSHISHERDDSGHLLDRPADATQPVRSRRPQCRLDSPRLSLRRLAHAIFHRTARGVYPLPHRAPGLLVQHPAARPPPLLELELRDSRAPSRLRRPRRNSSRGRSPHCDRAVALRRRRRALLPQHVLQHRRHRSGAGELRHRTALLLGTVFAEGLGRLSASWPSISVLVPLAYLRSDSDEPLLPSIVRLLLLYFACMFRSRHHQMSRHPGLVTQYCLPSLERVLLLQLFHRLAPGVLESLRLSHESWCSLRPLTLDPQQALGRDQPRSDLQQVSRSRLQILRFGRIANPNSLLTPQRRLTIHFALDELRHHIVGRLAKYPLLALEVVVPAGKRHRQQFPRLQELDLPPVHLFAQRINDRSLDVLGFHRRQHLAHRLRKIHRHRRMQSFRTFQPNIPVQHPEIRPRRRLVERPLQPHRERQSFQRPPDFLAGRRARFVPSPAAILQLRHKPEFLISWRSCERRSIYNRKFPILNLTGSSYFPSSGARTFSARSTLEKGFCNSFTPGSSTLCCTTISSVYPVMYTIRVCGRLLKSFSAN